MADDTNILAMRYTLPGLGYFLVLYLCLAISLPTVMESQAWTALGALAVVGTVPVGYLAHQLYLLWNFRKGRIECWPHIRRLRELINKRDHITLHLDGERITVSTKELRKELVDLGEKYCKLTGVRDRDAKKLIEEQGYLTPLHDAIFLGMKIHDQSYKGPWTHARITRILLMTFGLAVLPWIPSGTAVLLTGCPNVLSNMGFYFSRWVPQIPAELRLPIMLIAVEFIFLGIVAFFVSRWSRNQSDLDEQFLTWLYDKYLDQRVTDCH